MTLAMRKKLIVSHLVDTQSFVHLSRVGTPSITADTRNLLLRPILKRKWNGFSENDAFWHPSEATDPPPNFTPGTYDYNVGFSLPRTPSGLIPLLKKALIKAHEKGNVQKAYLCCPNAVHVAIEPWDRKWGCGCVCLS